ncbi:cation:proton antiporter [Prosthecochloris sp. N3]|uniref:Cation:proton antiporter n=1 Tax=Prosthecochloris ethylica TaxID=2743976 RepID=A0ABR9XU45_9CHLB|nr:cation:proton antiporter [Prosthecochloris sp. ZM_2]MBF0587044.1 cation:proton antiporter [Prosthecochloris ethylica]MEC9487498.1 cation:proton antiporter [Prosthecochloris sp.]MBF0637330.1 cation:proton antiporter [Prosthecochloris ethylica]NUK48116.1 cation:proton antiporter [Prosthecochloris ethylica]RNA65877.1 sodium:proton exchanger [Prosthecochloris sp. ZM_2]
MSNIVFTDIALVVISATVLGWLSLLTRQPIIIAYILAGVLLGPWGLQLVSSIEFINEVSDIGITLLLFLAGLSLHPGKLMELFGKTFLLTLSTSALFAAVTGGILYLFGTPVSQAIITGVAMMFSSTILVVKLMPTNTLHQKHMGAVAIAVLIMQDIFAVLAIAFIKGGGTSSLTGWLTSMGVGVVLAGAAILAERYIIRHIIAQVQRYNELLNLVALGWCFLLALLAEKIGMSHEIGAFIAGVALANGPISNFLAEGLKFFRDFFLVLFFFTLGAKLDFSLLQSVLLPAALLTAALLVIKPLAFRIGFRLSGETPKFSKEMGVRLGQNSEFALIIAVLAAEAGILSELNSQLIQLVAIFTMTISSYILVFFFPTPLGTSKPLKID